MLFRSGLAAWASAAIFERVRIVGTLDPKWLEAELKRLAEEDARKAGGSGSGSGGGGG